MKSLRGVMLTALTASLLACTGPTVDGTAPPPASPTTAGEARCATASSGRRFCDETAEGGFDLAGAYDTAKFICSTASVEEIAHEFHTARDEVSAAMGVAEDYRGRAHQAAFEGCMDGFEGGT